MLEHVHLLIYLTTYQTILVNNTGPCWQNYTSMNVNSTSIWQQCGLNKDFLQSSLIMWQWVTGGYFSMILAAILCAFTYIKYHKVIYPMIIGTMMLPISYFLFPATFLNYAFVMMGVGIAVLVWYIFISQSTEQ